MKETRPLPWWVTVAAAVTFFNAWVLFEEVVIDRHGLWQYMPLYVRGRACTWDAAAIVIISVAVWRLSRRSSASRTRAVGGS